MTLLMNCVSDYLYRLRFRFIFCSNHLTRFPGAHNVTHRPLPRQESSQSRAASPDTF